MWRYLEILTAILSCLATTRSQSGGLLRVGIQASTQSLVDATYGPIFEGKFGQLNYTVISTALVNDAAIYAAAEAGSFDVFYGGPTIFNCLQSQYGLRGIAAGIDLENSQETPYLGAEMVARTTSGISNILQMSGTRVALTQLTHVAGCLAQWGEMRRNGLDLFVDTKAVILANTSASVLNAIATGVADVGFLRSGTVEQQTQIGKYQMGTFQVVNELNEGFPWPVSTPLYPAILVAVSRSLTNNLATELAEALFEEDGLSLQANISRWVPLQDYVPTQALQVALGVMFANLTQCYRVTSYYDSIVCPAGYHKADETKLETSCDGILECATDLYTCICGPCLKTTSNERNRKWLAVIVVPVLFVAWVSFVIVKRRKYHVESIKYETLNVKAEIVGQNKYGHIWSGSYKGADVELRRTKLNDIGYKRNENLGWWGCIYLTGQQTLNEMVLGRVQDLAQLRHPNVEQGIGATLKAGEVMLVSSKSSNGYLKDLLYNPTVELERGMVISLLYDIARGLEYLESQEYEFDSEDFDAESVVLNEEFRAMLRLDNVSETLNPENRTGNEQTLAFGRLMYYMVYRRQRLLSTIDQGIFTFQSYEILKKEGESGVINLLQDCLADDITARPSMKSIVDVLHRRSDRSFGDTLNQLKIRNILQQMLPVDVVNDIKMKRKPPPKTYEDVSLCIIDVSHKALKISSVSELVEIGSSVRSICETLSTRSCLMTLKPLSDDTRFIAVGNLMSPLQNQVSVIMDFAIEAIQKISRIPLRNNEGFIRVQGGVHVGRVTSCIMGRENARYSLLGPDMVLASQLQLRSEPDHLLVSTKAANRALLAKRNYPYGFFTSSFGRRSAVPKVQDSVWLCATGSQSQPQNSKDDALISIRQVPMNKKKSDA